MGEEGGKEKDGKYIVSYARRKRDRMNIAEKDMVQKLASFMFFYPFCFSSFFLLFESSYPPFHP